MIFFFFFQAEDGIRDLTVTGVQTCALPIFRRWPRISRKNFRGHRRKFFLDIRVIIPIARCAAHPAPDLNETDAALDHSARDQTRSEERRVGKGGRDRWWTDAR